MSDDDLYIGPTVLEPGPREPFNSDHLARWVVVPLIVALTALILVLYIFFSTAVVDGDSMAPTLVNGDYLLLTHGDPAPRKGDVVVTRVLDNGLFVELVKRVIAVPGDTVEVRNDVAIVNGVPEPARGQVVDPTYSVSRSRQVIASGYIYVMGDNRPISEDSRYLGPVAISGIKGKAVFIFAPITHVRTL